MNNNDINLAGFTDILADEICDTQDSHPLSLSSGESDLGNRDNHSECVRNPNVAVELQKPAKGTGQYGQFRSVEEIDPKYRDVFTYPYFNLVQSSVIDDALYSDKSMVVCAPTGSGKTVVFEMAIVQLLIELHDKKYDDDFKIIYMAPVKAICTERLTEWYPKFTKFGLNCIVVTGDTNVDFAQLKPYRIIITTPEKWDMVTRRWREHRQLVEVIKLFLIDEVHILNDEVRGPVLEAVVSRMKTIESSAQSAHRIEQLQNQYQGTETTLKSPPKIRFIAVSATISNPEDVAAWLGSNDKPAVYYKFGDESRPVKLKRVVEGYPCPEGTSIFKFDIVLNYKLWPVIQKYHNGKPTLIFCNTRKSVALTADTLSKVLTVSFSPEQRAKLTALASTIKNKKLQTLILSGVGCHHAGLLYEERVNIEHAFRNRDLPILITTTTLAMGVNLPAHLVIIKNTQQYVNGAYQEYSISTILQMVGRAGRPQFDTEATAVIMTRLCDKPRYQALVGGSEPLQSFLHKRIAENLNSEAALCTVTDVAQCVQWLRSTFLCVRAAKDPRRYLGLPNAAPQQQITKKLEELCVIAMNGLASNGLITMDEASCIESTEAGRLMSIYYLDLETMKLIMKITGSETLEQLLWIVCESHELSDMHLRVDERRCLNTLNRNNAAATIRFPMKGKVNSRQMKLNCIIQAILGCLPIPDPSLNQEAMKVMRIACRICKCLVAYVSRPALTAEQPKFYSAVLNAIILDKCMEAHLWENSPYVSKQLKGIGPTYSTLLATAGKVNFLVLEESHPRDLERIMNKGPPAGNVLRKQILLLPKYQLTMTPIDEKTVSIQLNLLNLNHLAENMDNLTAGESHKSYLIVGDSENNLLLLSSFKDKDLISVYDGAITHQITRKHSFEHKMFAKCISSTFVGMDAHCDFQFVELGKDFNIPQAETPNPEFRRPATKQTTITDSYKERKRKSNSDVDLTQSKEKKKRESTLVEKFKILKESFGKTSKESRDDLDKSAFMSNKILKDLTLAHTQTNAEMPKSVINTVEESPVISHYGNSTAPVPSWDDDMIQEDSDFIDDKNINKILMDIEKEIIKGRDKTLPQKNATQCVQRCSLGNDKYPRDTNIQNYNKPYTPSIKRTKLTKSNYNFLEIMEKKQDLCEGENNNPEHDNGFSAMITDQINKYLEDTKRNSKPPESISEFLKARECQSSSFNTNLDQNRQTLHENEYNEKHYFESALTQNGNLFPVQGNNIVKSNDAKVVEIQGQYETIDTENTKMNQNTPDNVTKTNVNTNGVYTYIANNNSTSPQKDIGNFNIDNSFFKREVNRSNETNLRDMTLVLCDHNALAVTPIASKQPDVLLHSPCSVEIENRIEAGVGCNNVLNKSLANDIRISDIKEPCNKISTIKDDITNENNLHNNNELLFMDKNANIRTYSFSKTKIDVASTSTSDAVIQVIRKIKVDLNITEIISQKKKEDKHIHEDKENHQLEKYYEVQTSPRKPKTLERNFDKPMDITQPLQFHENKEEQNKKPEDTVCDNEAINNFKAIDLYDDIPFQQQKQKEILDHVNLNILDSKTEDNDTSSQTTEQTLHNILQKYSKILRKEHFQNKPSQLKLAEKALSQQSLKLKRPFKITDIQKVSTPLPNSLISENSKLEGTPEVLTHPTIARLSEKVTQSLEPVIYSKNVQTNIHNANVSTDAVEQNECLAKNFEEIPEIQFPTMAIDEIELGEPEKEYKIDQAMFNPKTLLQQIGKDELDNFIVPPPPEFSDELNPTQSTQSTNIPMDCYEPTQWNTIFQSNLEEHNIFDASQTTIASDKEIETWTFSQNDDNYEDLAASRMFTTPTLNTYPILKTQSNNMNPNSAYQNASVSRQNKLGQFKFSNDKKKMKFRS